MQNDGHNNDQEGRILTVPKKRKSSTLNADSARLKSKLKASLKMRQYVALVPEHILVLNGRDVEISIFKNTQTQR